MTRRLVTADMLQAIDNQEHVTLNRLGELTEQRGTPFREDPAVVGTGGGGDGGSLRWRLLAERGRDSSGKRLSLGIRGAQPDPAGRLRGHGLGDGRGLPVAGARDHERYPTLAGTREQGGNPWAGNRRRSARAARSWHVRGAAHAGSLNHASIRGRIFKHLQPELTARLPALPARLGLVGKQHPFR